MSLTFGFYNSVNGDRTYDALDVSRLFDGLIRDGVYGHVGKKFEVKAASGMQITVGTGRAWFQHTWTLLTAESSSAPDIGMTLTVENGGPSARTDCVVLEVDTRNEGEHPRSNRIFVKQNIAWTAVTNTGIVGLYRFPLAEIAVPANATSITDANITDCVGRGTNPGGSNNKVYTPIVTAVLEAPDFSVILQQINTDASGNLTNLQNSLRNSFSTWFSGLQTRTDADIDYLMAQWTDQLNRFYSEYTDDADAALMALLNEALYQARNLRIFNHDVPTGAGQSVTLTGDFWNRETQTDFYPPSANLQAGDYVIGTNGYLAKITHLADTSSQQGDISHMTEVSLEGTGITFVQQSSGTSDIPVVQASSSDGESYYSSITLPSSIRALGKQIIFVPLRTSNSKTVMLNLTVEGSGGSTSTVYDQIVCRSGVNQQAYKNTLHKSAMQGPSNDWLIEGTPYLLTYGNNRWYVDSYIESPTMRLYMGGAIQGSGFYLISAIFPFDGFKNGDLIYPIVTGDPSYTPKIYRVTNYDFTQVNSQVYFTPIQVY